MRFAWVLNLDAEFELAQNSYNPSARLSAQLAHFGAASRHLLGPDDILIEPGAPAVESERIGRAWCPTPRAISLLRASGVTPEPSPDPRILRLVNHRQFAFELGGGLPGSIYTQSHAELDSVLRRTGHPWLLKRPLAFAGRGQLRVYAYDRITAKEWSWIEASLLRDGLLIEPLVVPLIELSWHGFIWRDGRFELGRPCVQQVSARGVFRDVRWLEPGELDLTSSRQFEASAERTASALAAAGYFGPFGIDSYRYELDGRAAFCERSEINARYTMGFVVGFPRHPTELAL